jgi:hypothetical protein
MTQELDNLKEALKKILEEMEKKGLKLNIKDKSALINTVANNILKVRPGITKNDLLDPKFISALQISLVSHHLNTNVPGFKYDYTKLFQFNKHELLLNDQARKEQEKELTNALKMMLTVLYKLTPHPGQKWTDKDIDRVAENLAKLIMGNYMKNNDQLSLQQSNSAQNVLFELLRQTIKASFQNELSKVKNDPNASPEAITKAQKDYDACMRVLFGVAKAGEVQRPNEGIPTNFMGFTTSSGTNESSMTFMDELFRFDGKADPSGIENVNLGRDVASGFSGATQEEIVQNQSKSGYQSPTPFSTKPTPPGTASR